MTFKQKKWLGNKKQSHIELEHIENVESPYEVSRIFHGINLYEGFSYIRRVSEKVIFVAIFEK